jgi:hypothetical protein
MWFVAVTKAHMDSEDLARFASAPDFWDDEPTVRVEMCGHCVRLLSRCECVIQLDVSDMEEVR